MKKPISMLMAMAIAASIPATALAASPAGPEVSVSGQGGKTPVTLTTVGNNPTNPDGPYVPGTEGSISTFSVTVPTNLAIAVKADGQIICATKAEIVNNGNGPVKVSNMTIAGASQWSTVNWNTDMRKEKVNAKKLGMTINGAQTTGSNAINFAGGTFPVMNGKDSLDHSNKMAITYDAKVPAQTNVLDKANIANVTFTICWDTVA